MNSVNAARADETAGELIDTAIIPGGASLQLVRYGADFEILHGGDQLMGSWENRSEKALATLVCQRLDGCAERVLVGGLGMGFTLGAALAAFPLTTSILVAELVPQVVTWAGGPLAHLFGKSLSDPRVSLVVRDVHDVIIERPEAFDAILLDVDNGPEGLISVANERLYSSWGLRAAFTALRPGGMLAVWSAYFDDDFSDRLTRSGFSVEEVRIAIERDHPEFSHVIWLATRPGSAFDEQASIPTNAGPFCG